MIFLVSLTLTDAGGLPFWKAKPEVFRSIIEDREIVVSVTSQNAKKGGLVGFSFKGAGLVRAPLAFCQNKVVEFEKLKEISSHIKETKYNLENKELFFHGEALGYHALMWMKIETLTRNEVFEMHFEVVRGHLVGLKGVITIEDHKRQMSLISLDGNYSAQKLGLPAKLLNYGLEIVLQQVAKKIRNYLEAEVKKKEL